MDGIFRSLFIMVCITQATFGSLSVRKEEKVTEIVSDQIEKICTETVQLMIVHADHTVEEFQKTFMDCHNFDKNKGDGYKKK